MRVLVTGASGGIGRAFCAAVGDAPPASGGGEPAGGELAGGELAGGAQAGGEPARIGRRLELVRADLEDRDPGSPFPFRELDVTDQQACREACVEVDAVLHLAADPSPDADFRTSVLPVNMVGTYNIANAAVSAGVERFVFASSAQVVEGYAEDRQVRETDAPWPANDYGVGKAFGEALCAALASNASTRFVALRIGNYAAEVPDETVRFRDRTAWLSPRDANQLLLLALTAEVGPYLVVNGVSDNAVKRLTLDQTTAVLGYRPVDDAFGGRLPGRV